MASNQQQNAVPKAHLRQRVFAWFKSELGSGVFNLDHAHLDQALNNLFGYHILQIGNLNNTSLLGNSRISHKIVHDFYRDNDPQSITNIVADSKSLAIESDSMDVVVLPHVLEFETSPHQLLREAERILIGEGHIIIIGFNPWSLWGLWRVCLAWRDEPPWCGRFISLSRVKDWLSLLDFELVITKNFYFRPPLKRRGLMKRLQFMEKLGQFLWPYFGGIYMVVAKKRVVPLTPIKLSWHRRRSIISGVVEPSARINNQ